MNSKINSHDTAVFLQWAGFAMIVIYGVTVLMEMLPLALFKPIWLVQSSARILGGGAFALTGAVLLVFALHFDSRVLPLSRFHHALRRLARIVALSLLLLIPLQTIAGLMVWSSEIKDVQQRLSQLQQATEVINKANNESALIQGLSLLPGAPQPNGQKLTMPVPVVKTQVLAQLNRQIPLLKTRISEVKKLRLENGMAQWLKQGVISAAYALAFWMLGGIRFQSPRGLEEYQAFMPANSLPTLQRARPTQVDDLTIPPEWLEEIESIESSGS